MRVTSTLCYTLSYCLATGDAALPLRRILPWAEAIASIFAGAQADVELPALSADALMRPR